MECNDGDSDQGSGINEPNKDVTNHSKDVAKEDEPSALSSEVNQRSKKGSQDQTCPIDDCDVVVGCFQFDVVMVRNVVSKCQRLSAATLPRLAKEWRQGGIDGDDDQQTHPKPPRKFSRADESEFLFFGLSILNVHVPRLVKSLLDRSIQEDKHQSSAQRQTA